jgi:hypothetical protein
MNPQAFTRVTKAMPYQKRTDFIGNDRSSQNINFSGVNRQSKAPNSVSRFTQKNEQE